MLIFLCLACAPTPPAVPDRADSDRASIAIATNGLVADGTRLPLELASLFEEDPRRIWLSGNGGEAVPSAIAEMIALIEEEMDREASGAAPMPAEEGQNGEAASKEAPSS